MSGEFVPSESDKKWMRNTFALIAVGGIWGTSWAIYSKEDEQTLAVTSDISSVFTDAKQLANVKENIRRVQTVAESIGLKFVDRR
jgi:hypothetical protein